MQETLAWFLVRKIRWRRDRLPTPVFLDSLVVQVAKNLPAMWETWVQSLGWEGPLEKGTATHSSILAWRIPWTVYSKGSQRVRHNWEAFASLHFICLTESLCYTQKHNMVNQLCAQLLSHIWFFVTPWPVHFDFKKFSSVAQSCTTLCEPMDCSTPGLPVHHQLPEFTQTHVHWVGDAIQPSRPLVSPSPPALSASGSFQMINSSHQMAKVLEFQLQCHLFQWTFRTDLL